jgi:predicted dehydrogenase
MKSPLGVGIIGTGIIAREHAKALGMIPDAAILVAAADVSGDRLREFGDAFKISRRYGSAAELIADPNVDLVAIATPPAAHEEPAIAALDAGKYVFCEKPLAHSLASAARIIAADTRHPGRLTVAYQLHYDPSFRRLLWLCQNKWVGEIQSAVIERYGIIAHAASGKAGWWGSWDVAGGGVLLTQLIHELDSLLLVMGDPVSVRAEMDTRYTGIESEDYVDTTILFSGGRTARCIAAVNSGRLGGRFVIEGNGGQVSLPRNLTLNDPARLPEALSAVDKALPNTRRASTSTVNRGMRFLARRIGLKPTPELTSHALLYRDIVRSISAGVPLPIPPSQAMKSLNLCMAAYESALAGKKVEVSNSLRSIYDGVSKAAYDARVCSRRKVQMVERNMPRRPINGTVRVGLIGLDTTHATTFAKLLHDPYDPFHIPGARVVAAYPGGSPDMEISISRVAGFTNEVRTTYGIPIMDSPEAVVDASDLIFILASDGRLHLGLFKSVAGHGKPVFVDKPFAISGDDAQEIFKIAADTGTHVFASSGFRYADALVAALIQIREAGEKIKSCRIRCWLPVQETQGRYFWYGIHGAEMLVASIGGGVTEVAASGGPNQDIITVRHGDGFQSKIVGSHSDGNFAISLETDKRHVEIDLSPSMPSLSARLLWTVLDVLTEGQYPRLWRATSVGSVSGPRASRMLDPKFEETMEVIRLLEAAQLSYASGKPVVVGKP